ncbi:50S ribosomal protein L32e [Candidatus Woesearchaeota archaeon]|nr:50S ribosomal protein L32e [Candidatus Woesearchaeota archaeon]
MSLLSKRKEIKKKKPDFIMQDAHKKARLKKKWRKPRGIDSKIRLNLKGYRKSVEPGYGSPKEVRHLHNSGLEPLIVYGMGDIKNIDKEKQGIVLSKKLGNKKRIEMVKKAKELSIRVLNIKDSDAYIKKVENAIKAKKTKREQKKKKAEGKGKKSKKEKGLSEKVKNEEEKAGAEKREKDKLLTKKDI